MPQTATTYTVQFFDRVGGDLVAAPVLTFESKDEAFRRAIREIDRTGVVVAERATDGSSEWLLQAGDVPPGAAP